MDVTYVDGNGVLYDSRYFRLDTPAPKPVPFPSAHALEADLFEWVKLVDTSLGKTVLPVGVSRVYCRPRYAPGELHVEGAATATPDDTEDASDTLGEAAWPRSIHNTANIISPRAIPELVSPRFKGVDSRSNTGTVTPELLSPRIAQVEVDAVADQTVPRGAWRAMLIPAVPSDDSEDGETLLRWARLVLDQCRGLPPHPRELIERLGIKQKLFLDAAQEITSPQPNRPVAAATESAQHTVLAVARKMVSVWERAVLRGERGWNIEGKKKKTINLCF
jgi:hypothetical protein